MDRVDCGVAYIKNISLKQILEPNKKLHNIFSIVIFTVRLGFSSSNCLSNACNWRKKWKFGDISGLRKRTNANASSKFKRRECIKYASVTVTDRDTPAKQCTSTAESFFRASSKFEKNKKLLFLKH